MDPFDELSRYRANSPGPASAGSASRAGSTSLLQTASGGPPGRAATATGGQQQSTKHGVSINAFNDLLPTLFPSQTAGIPLRAQPKSRDSSPSGMNAQTVGQPGTAVNPGTAAGRWSNMGAPPLPTGKWAQPTPQYQPTLVSPPWEGSPAQSADAGTTLQQVPHLTTPPSSASTLANGSPLGTPHLRVGQSTDPFSMGPAQAGSASPTRAGPHSRNHPNEPFSALLGQANQADPFGFSPLGAHMSTASAPTGGFAAPSIQQQTRNAGAGPQAPLSNGQPGSHVDGAPPVMQLAAGSANPFGDALFGQHSHSAGSSPRVGSSAASSPTANANPFGDLHPGQGFAPFAPAGAQSAAASSLSSSIQQQQQQLLQQHQQQQASLRNGLDPQDPFAHSYGFPPAAVPDMTPSGLATVPQPPSSGSAAQAAGVQGLPQGAQGSANPFGFSKFEPLSSMAARPSEASAFQPLGFSVPAESWDAFEQMQRPQQQPLQPPLQSSDPQPVIEPGSQPLPPGPHLQVPQGARGLPPRGRAERRPSGPAAADGYSSQAREAVGAPAADGSPLQPTAVQVPAAAARPVVVNGVSDELLNRWFGEADEDLDGRVAGEEARRFFNRTGLPHVALRKVMSLVRSTLETPDNGLNREQFALSLRLVAAAQSTEAYTDDVLSLALQAGRWEAARGQALPPPMLLPAEQPAPAMYTTLGGERLRSVDSWGSQQGSGSGTFGHSGHSGHIPDLQRHSADPFEQLSRRSPVPGMEKGPQSRVPPSPSSYGKSSSFRSRPGSPSRRRLHMAPDAPVPYCVRLPPMHPKRSSRLTCLAAAAGSLLAGPLLPGPGTFSGALQWTNVEGDLACPSAAGGRGFSPTSGPSEDADSAPSHELRVKGGSNVTCMHVDEAAGLLWMGHEDGMVTGFRLGGYRPGTCLDPHRFTQWQAHRAGVVSAITSTPWGELWTASSRGVLRVWDSANQDEPARELRKPGGAKAHGSHVEHMVVPPGGQVVWTSSHRTLSMWCAYTGAHLGSITKDNHLENGTPGVHDSTIEGQRHIHVNSKKGLDQNADGSIANAPDPTFRENYKNEQEDWAAQTDTRSAEIKERIVHRAGAAGRAMKGLGAMTMKLARQNFASNAAREALDSASMSGTSQSSGGGSPRDKKNHWARDSFRTDSFREAGGDQRLGHVTSMVAAADGSIWVAFGRGRLERYTALGMLLSCKELGRSVRCLCPVGQRMWAGMANGRLQVWADGKLLREWRAHQAKVIGLVQAGSRVFSLAEDGCICGWSAFTPSAADMKASGTYQAEAAQALETKRLQALCVTWNVNERFPEAGCPLFAWLRNTSAACNLAMIGLQEVEMGGGSVAMGTVKDNLFRGIQERGNDNARFWYNRISDFLPSNAWTRIGLRQMSGLLLLVYARNEIQGSIGEVSTASVACGVLGVGGNKGAVAVAFTLFRRRVTCICSHFAAHQANIEARNNNYVNIVRHLKFTRKQLMETQSETTKPDDQEEGEDGNDSADSDAETHSEMGDLDSHGSGVRDTEFLVWMGDFNYRINGIARTDIIDKSRRGDLRDLVLADQLRQEQERGRIFHHLKEGKIIFHPTYKFDRANRDPFAYDSGEKLRVPAYTDRIFFRGSVNDSLQELEQESDSCHAVESGCVDVQKGHSPLRRKLCRPLACLGPLCPFRPPGHEQEADARAAELTSADEMPRHAAADDIRVTCPPECYNALFEVVDSDHKPVWALLHADVPVADQSHLRGLASTLLSRGDAALLPAPACLRLSSQLVQLQVGSRRGQLQISNVGESAASFMVTQRPAEGGSCSRDSGLPVWLHACPVSGILQPQASAVIKFTAALQDSRYVSHALIADLRIAASNLYQSGMAAAQSAAPIDAQLQVTYVPG